MNRRQGIIQALGAAVLFGLSTPLAKLVVASTDPLLVAGLLYLGSGVGLAVVRLLHAAQADHSHDTDLRRTDLPWLAGAIFSGGILAPALLLFGLLTTPASTASLLLNLEAVATAVIAWTIFKENVDRRIGAGFLSILLGGLLLTIPSGHVGFSPGAILVIAACICWGIDNNLTRKISASDASQIAMWKGLVAGLVNTALAFIIGARFPSIGLTVSAAAIGFFGYGVSLVLFVTALRHLGAARTGAYFSTAPFVGTAAAIALGQGQPGWILGASGVLMAIGVWLHVTEKHAHAHVHEPMEHAHAHVHDEHHQHEHSSDDPPGEPHTHLHRHTHLRHSHPHYPDVHHQHEH